jgi:hypothetical protein
MGKYCAIHIKGKNRDALVAELERYVAETYRGRVIRTTTAKDFGALYGEEFLCAVDPPTKFAVISEQRGWFTVHYNSFCRMRDFAEELSGTLKTLVITTLAQTTSDVYALGIFDAGHHLRTLEFGDGSWVKQEGSLLPFEKAPLGKNIAEPGEDPYYVFEEASVSEYCKHYGLKFWTNAWMKMEKPEWTIIQALRARIYAVEERD